MTAVRRRTRPGRRRCRDVGATRPAARATRRRRLRQRRRHPSPPSRRAPSSASTSTCRPSTATFDRAATRAGVGSTAGRRRRSPALEANRRPDSTTCSRDARCSANRSTTALTDATSNTADYRTEYTIFSNDQRTIHRYRIISSCKSFAFFAVNLSALVKCRFCLSILRIIKLLCCSLSTDRKWFCRHACATVREH